MCDGRAAILRYEDKKFTEITGGMPKKLKDKLYVPQLGEKYYSPTLDDGKFWWDYWEGTDEEIEFLQLGLVCQTSEYASELADIMLEVSSGHKTFRPRNNQIYFHPVLEKKLIEAEVWYGDEFDIDNLYYGLVCKTEEQAKALAKELLATLWDYRSDRG